MMWVDVDDRLPTEGDLVWCFMASGAVSLGAFRDGRWADKRDPRGEAVMIVAWTPAIPPGPPSKVWLGPEELERLRNLDDPGF